MLRERVQTEALRTYLFAYGLHYASVSQDQLAASFQLPDKKVWFSPLPGVLMHPLFPAHTALRCSPCSICIRHSCEATMHIHICRPGSTAVSCDWGSSGFVKVLQVHAVVSKMMMEEGFAGSWDQPTRSVVMHNAQPSRLQTLASELSDRAAGDSHYCTSRCCWLLTAPSDAFAMKC